MPYQRANEGLQLFGYVILENHLHFVAQAPRLDKCLSSFKSFTAGRLIELLEVHKAKRLLDRLRLAKQAHKRDREYQFWQEGSHAELICSEPVMRQKLDYMHQNPVQRGYVDLPEHWRYSSARNYLGQAGLIEIDPWFCTGRDAGASRLRSHAGAWERSKGPVNSNIMHSMTIERRKDCTYEWRATEEPPPWSHS